MIRRRYAAVHGLAESETHPAERLVVSRHWSLKRATRRAAHRQGRLKYQNVRDRGHAFWVEDLDR